MLARHAMLTDTSSNKNRSFIF